jgi:hypothetical protein
VCEAYSAVVSSGGARECGTLPFWLKPIEAQVPQVLLHILAHFHLIFCLRGGSRWRACKDKGTLQIVSDWGASDRSDFVTNWVSFRSCDLGELQIVLISCADLGSFRSF